MSDARSLTRIGDRMWVSGAIEQKHSIFSNDYRNRQVYFAPSIMESDMAKPDAHKHLQRYRILHRYSFDQPREVISLGWTYLYVGKFIYNRDWFGTLENREAIPVMVVMPYRSNQQYRKHFYTMPDQVVSLNAKPIR